MAAWRTSRHNIPNELSTLASRALVMHVTRTMPLPSKLEREAANICRLLQKLHYAQPEKATARQEFLKGIVKVAKRRKDGSEPYMEGRNMQAVAQHWFSRHAVLWAQQTVQVQAA